MDSKGTVPTQSGSLSTIDHFRTLKDMLSEPGGRHASAKELADEISSNRLQDWKIRKFLGVLSKRDAKVLLVLAIAKVMIKPDPDFDGLFDHLFGKGE